MASGKVAFDDVPEALTDTISRELYGLEAGDVMGTSQPAPDFIGQPLSAVA
jgi:phosphonate transport system ATP-binding protein